MAKQLKFLDKIEWVDVKRGMIAQSVSKTAVNVISEPLLIADKKRGCVCGFYMLHLIDRNGPFENVKAGEGFYFDIDGVKLDDVVKYCSLDSLVG